MAWHQGGWPGDKDYMGAYEIDRKCVARDRPATFDRFPNFLERRYFIASDYFAVYCFWNFEGLYMI